jgi:hypothetical protein
VTVGTPFVPFQEPRKPKLVLAPAATAPLCAALVAVTAEPLLVTVAFHACVTVCPLAYVQVTRQPRSAAAPAVTRTSAWKPPCHWLVTAYVAVHAPGGGVTGGGVVGGGVVGGGVTGGGVVGGGVTGGGEVGVVVPPQPAVLSSHAARRSIQSRIACT